MLKVIKEIEKDWFLILLEGTKIHQVWNRLDLYEKLLENGSNHLLEGDTMTDSELKKVIQKIKELKEWENLHKKNL
jgi:hypothetical protein